MLGQQNRTFKSLFDQSHSMGPGPEPRRDLGSVHMGAQGGPLGGARPGMSAGGPQGPGGMPPGNPAQPGGPMKPGGYMKKLLKGAMNRYDPLSPQNRHFFG